MEPLIDGPSAPFEIMAFGLSIVIVLLLAPNGVAGIGKKFASFKPALAGTTGADQT